MCSPWPGFHTIVCSPAPSKAVVVPIPLNGVLRIVSLTCWIRPVAGAPVAVGTAGALGRGRVVSGSGPSRIPAGTGATGDREAPFVEACLMKSAQVVGASATY
ncbi:hypothetical protein ACQ4WX_29130 [Streptomyces lasalocidi]